MAARQDGSRRFRATIGGTEKGRVFIVLPFDPADAWGVRARYDVNGTVNSMKFRNSLAESATGYFLSLGPAWRRCTDLHPGDKVDVVIAPESPAPREGLASDIAAALADPEAASFWDRLAGFYRKAYLRWIDATKRRPDVRAERIAELVQLMKAGMKERPH